MTRPERTLHDHQRQSLSTELKDRVRWLLDRPRDAKGVEYGQATYEVIRHQAKEMGRGFPASSLGGDGGSGHGDRVSTLAGNAVDRERAGLPAADPGAAAGDWLTEFDEWVAAGKRLERRARGLLPKSEAEVTRGRENTVEVCVECGEPAPKVKRLDGQPYHHPESGLSCWRTAYDRQRPDRQRAC